MARKAEIAKYVDKILDTGLSPSDEKYSEAIKSYAEKFIYTNKMQIERNMIAIDQEIIKLQKNTLSHLDPDESPSIEKAITRYEIERSIWELALKLRHERFYRQPSYPMEKNIIDHGVFSITSKAKRGSKKELETVDISNEIERQTGKAIIRHSFGMDLTVFDAKVLLVIQKLWEEQGKRKEFEVSLYQIAKKLNKPLSGQTYKEIKQSLFALFEAKIQFQLFNSNGLAVETDYLRLLQSLGDKGEVARMMFTDKIYESLQSGYFIYLSLAILEDLSSNTAQGLYPYIVSQTAHGIREWYLAEICNLLNIRQPRPSRRAEIVSTACEEMKEFGVINNYEIFQDSAGAQKLRIEPSEMISNTMPLPQHERSQQLKLDY